MTKREIFSIIRRNKHKKHAAIVLISDFLAITMKEARKIYQEEFENV